MSLVSQVVSINEPLDVEMNADNRHAKLAVKLIETLLLYIESPHNGNSRQPLERILELPRA